MIKHLSIILVTLIGLALPVKAQSFVGSWELLPNYATPSKTIETADYVYVLAGTSLCCYDKSTGEVAAYNSTNRLNGSKVTNLWYNPDGRYIIVVYNDFNIDLIYDDGRIINVPDLRDAAVTYDKTIKDVSFTGSKAFAALNNGLLEIDAAHGAVTESYIWNKPVNYVAASDKYITVIIGSPDFKMYYAPVKGKFHDFDTAFTEMPDGFGNAVAMERLSSTGISAATASALWGFDFSGETPVRKWLANGTFTANTMVPTRNGVMIPSGTNIVNVNKSYNVTTTAVAASSNQKVADYNGTAENLWMADATGFGRYNVASKAYNIAKMKPRGTSGSNVGRIVQHSNGNFYISTAEYGITDLPGALAKGVKPAIDIYYPESKTFKALPNTKLKTWHAALDLIPDNDDTILLGCVFSSGGLYTISTNTYTGFNGLAAPFSNQNIFRHYVDTNGNLWSLQWLENGILVGKALKGSWENGAKPAGWSSIIMPNLNPVFSMNMIVDEAKGNIVVTGHNGIGVLKMPDADKPLTSSTPAAFVSCTVDEDGNSFGGWKFPALAIDKNGWLWGGNDKGVFVIKDTDRMFDYGFSVMRPKVPRNDGTNLADYLLDQVEVYTIEVDSNNNKWIGTIGSGLYRVNEDGSQIVEHLTTETSELPANDILAICADRNSNDVYVGTEMGLAIYHSTSSPAAEDYSDAYAYPNPVTPDYTGYITITGLKANSLVKIADAQGNVFFETRSDGGMALWNGCDASGRRVRSGVYFVFASETGEGGSDAAVTKIVVVN